MRMLPVRAGPIFPPLKIIAAVHTAGWRDKDQGTGLEGFRRNTGIFAGIGRALGESDVSGGLDELSKGPVGDGEAIYPESVNGNPVDGTLLRIVLSEPIRNVPPGT